MTPPIIVQVPHLFSLTCLPSPPSLPFSSFFFFFKETVITWRAQDHRYHWIELNIHEGPPGVQIADNCDTWTSPRVKLSVRRNIRNSVCLCCTFPLFLSSRYVTRNNSCATSQTASSNMCLTSSMPLGRYGVSFIKQIAVRDRYGLWGFFPVRSNMLKNIVLKRL